MTEQNGQVEGSQAIAVAGERRGIAVMEIGKATRRLFLDGNQSGTIEDIITSGIIPSADGLQFFVNDVQATLNSPISDGDVVVAIKMGSNG